ncbi:hypothetical protein [Thauera sp.]
MSTWQAKEQLSIVPGKRPDGRQARPAVALLWRAWAQVICMLCAALLLAACSAGELPQTSAPPDEAPAGSEPRDEAPAIDEPAPPPPPPPAAEPEPPSVIDRPAVVRPPAAANGSPPTASRPEPTVLPAFPWPPPRYSAFALLERAWLAPQEPATLGRAAQHLEDAFDLAGYVERSYYRVPGGFALASRAEKIHPDASPFAPPARWSADSAGAGRSFLDRITALFNAPPGRYRVIVFVVTDQDFAATPQPPSEAVAREWVGGGGLRLPPSIAAQAYSAEHYASALIYEFARRDEREAGQVRAPSDVPGRVHLEKGGLWQALAQ